MKTQNEATVQFISVTDSQNTKLFLSILSDDPVLLDAARKEGLIVFSSEDQKDPVAKEFTTAAECGYAKEPKGDDNSQPTRHTDPMNDITREELRSLLSAIEDRSDRRIDQILKVEASRIESQSREQYAYRHEQEARDRLYSERFEAMSRRLEDRDRVIDGKLDTMNASIKGMTDKVDRFSQSLNAHVAEVKSSNRNTVLGILAIGVATVIGLWGANSTIVGSASSIFQSGQQQTINDTSLKILIDEVNRQSAETRALLEALKLNQHAPEAAPTSK
ncbi:hypothetical protein [Pseudomonas putida]|uniref:hypothetical protein n=1 Tax=Pseudomonas putida TaxID=303 RepID=UPI001E419FA3|nr:hypothetical protein [Pseudomonas putida]